MKETVKINLNQRLFDLDADAYEKLKDYLDSLRAYFKKTSEEAEDILQDIEQRIAEVLEDKLGTTKQVVTVSDIEEVIQLMGTADDFAREAELQDDEEYSNFEEKKTESSSSFNKQHRRLYRDLENNIIGGVCSGLASYFNVDSVWIRLAFIILLFFEGLGLLAYIVMWIAMPGARTRAQKLQMKGQAVTIDNIQQSVKNEFTKVKNNINSFSKSESYKKAQNTAAEVFSTIGNIILVFFKVILVIIGIGLAIAGLVLIIALITTLIAGGSFFDWNLNFLPVQEFMYPLLNNFSLFGIALSLVIFIPVVAILVAVIKLIFNVRSRNSVLTAFAWTFWVLALVFVIASVASGDKIVSYSYKFSENKEVNIPANKTLYIELEDEMTNWNGIEQYSIFGKSIVHSDYSDVCYMHPQIEFKAAEKDETSMVIEHTAAIPAFDKDYRDGLYYYWNLNDTILLLDEYFSVDDDNIWQLPGVRITLFIPEEQKIFIDSDLRKLIRKKSIDLESEMDYNTVLVMRNGMLEPLAN